MNHNQPVIYPPPHTGYAGSMNRTRDLQFLIIHTSRMIHVRWLDDHSRLKVYLKFAFPNLLYSASNRWRICVDFIQKISPLLFFREVNQLKSRT